jgi:hypothetical protein
MANRAIPITAKTEENTSVISLVSAPKINASMRKAMAIKVTVI